MRSEWPQSFRAHGSEVGLSSLNTTEYAHPEGWRDRPCEAPATSAQLLPVVTARRARLVPSPARGQGDRWERWEEKSSPVTTATTRTSPSASGFGNATGLSCRECGKVYELGPHYACEECFGPLEVCYDFPRLTRADIEAGPPNIWRYAPLLPVPPDIASRPTTEPGYTKLIRADNLAARAGHAPAVDQGRQRQPDALVQGPGGRGGAGRRHRDGLQGAGLPVHRQPGQRGGRRGGPGRHAARWSWCPPTWNSRRSSPRPCTAARSSPWTAPTTT